MSGNRKFPELTASIAANYQINGPASISALQKVVALRSRVVGVDAAIAAVLQRNRDKRLVYPVVANLLESRDPDAQLRAAWILGYYALFCDQHGNLGQPGLTGPFAAASRNYMPRNDSALTPADYASFWKTWWATNKGSFGF